MKNKNYIPLFEEYTNNNDIPTSEIITPNDTLRILKDEIRKKTTAIVTYFDEEGKYYTIGKIEIFPAKDGYYASHEIDMQYQMPDRKSLVKIDKNLVDLVDKLVENQI